MNSRNRLLKIERRLSELKSLEDQTVLVRTGVWLCDDDGNIIPNSGPTRRVSQTEPDARGILLVPRPIGKDEWPECYERTEQYQNKLRTERGAAE